MTDTGPETEGKRRILVESAAEVFAKQGFAATRVSDISSHAGVGKGTVYEYFSSKEELFFAVFELINDEIRSRVDMTVTGSASAKEVLTAIFRSSAEIITEHREIFSMNLDFWAASRGSAFEDRFTTACRAMYQEYRELAAGVIRRGQDEGDFRTDFDADQVATMVVAALDGLGVQSWFDRAIDPLPASEAFSDALCSGLCRGSS
jgi:AcrR family transcriptional regulator